MAGRITRRSAVGILGASGLASALALGADGAPAPAAANAAPDAKEASTALRPGAPFGRWTIVAVHPVQRGALRVDVRPTAEPEGHVFALEILARDPSPATARPPAQTGELAIYVCNGGDGWLPTVEEQGLAAMTLALLLEKHGETGAIAGLLTHADRVVAHGDVLHASFIDASLLG